MPSALANVPCLDGVVPISVFPGIHVCRKAVTALVANEIEWPREDNSERTAGTSRTINANYLIPASQLEF